MDNAVRIAIAYCPAHRRSMPIRAMLGYTQGSKHYSSSSDCGVPIPEPWRQQPAAPQLPAIGDIFTGKVATADETAVLVTVPGFDEDKAIGVISADALGGRTDRYRTGNGARVEVVAVRALKRGRTVLELMPAAKRESR